MFSTPQPWSNLALVIVSIHNMRHHMAPLVCHLSAWSLGLFNVNWDGRPRCWGTGLHLPQECPLPIRPGLLTCYREQGLVARFFQRECEFFSHHHSLLDSILGCSPPIAGNEDILANKKAENMFTIVSGYQELWGSGTSDSDRGWSLVRKVWF